MANKVSAAQSFLSSPMMSAGFQNQVIDCTNDYNRRALGQVGDSGKSLILPTDVVKVQNLTGEARAKGDVIQLGDSLFTELNSRNIWFEAQEPAEPAYLRYAILLEPAEHRDDDPQPIVQAQASGVCIATVNIIDELHTHANIVEGEYVLTSGISGPIELLSAPDGTGEQDMAVRLCVAPPGGTGEAAATIANGASGDIDVMSGDPASESSSGLTEEMYNKGPDLADGDPVLWDWIRGELVCMKACS